MQSPVYLDNNATTPVDPIVLEAMLPFFNGVFGNASSHQHNYGLEAARAIETARQHVASLIGAREKEIVFTSGATESNNLALLGLARRCRDRGRHIITAVTEHKAVLEPCKQLEREGFTVTYLPVDEYGCVDPDDIALALTDQTILVSIMAANNEIGTLQEIHEIAHRCNQRGVLFHTDAAQALGKIPLQVDEMGIDLISLSAHKAYGPKGTGALFVRSRKPRVQLEPLFYGGGHENGLRSGTHDVPNIVGFGKACQLAHMHLESEPPRLNRLRERLCTRIQAGLSGVKVNGHPTAVLPGLLHLSFAGIDAESLMFALQEVAMSHGSSCTSGSLEPSHVLRAIGVTEEWERGSIRLGVGRFTSEEEIDWVSNRVVETVRHLRRSHASLGS